MTSVARRQEKRRRRGGRGHPGRIGVASGNGAVSEESRSLTTKIVSCCCRWLSLCLSFAVCFDVVIWFP